MVTEENLAEGRVFPLPPSQQHQRGVFQDRRQGKTNALPATVFLLTLFNQETDVFFLSHPFPPASSPRSASDVLGGELRVQTQHRLGLPRAKGQGGLCVVSHLQPRLRLLHPGLLQLARGGHELAGRVRGNRPAPLRHHRRRRRHHRLPGRPQMGCTGCDINSHMQSIAVWAHLSCNEITNTLGTPTIYSMHSGCRVPLDACLPCFCVVQYCILMAFLYFS